MNIKCLKILRENVSKILRENVSKILRENVSKKLRENVVFLFKILRENVSKILRENVSKILREFIVFFYLNLKIFILSKLKMEVQGFPDYLIYQDGRIWSNKTNRFLKPGDNGRGYLCVGLRKNGKSYTKYIHRLMGSNYIANPNNYLEIDHKDRNTHNNNIDNLRWVTHSQNQHNKGMRKDNKIGISNIMYMDSRNAYKFEKSFNGKRHQYYSKTLGGILARKIIFNVLNNQEY